MNQRKDLHGGHRERLKERLLKFPKSLSDHELLEALMFYSIPRRDTNGISHELLSTFGSVKNVLSAKKEELTFIEGVGENTAVLFNLVSEIAERVSKIKQNEKEYCGFNDIKAEMVEYFKEIRSAEEFLVYLLDKNKRKIARTSFDCGKTHEISLDSGKINELFLRYSPKYVILAHNHPSGNVTPSEDDKAATKRMLLFSRLHGARVLDHIIVSGEKTYSFFQEDELNIEFSQKEINDLLKGFKE